MATPMTLEVASEILRQAYRHILADHSFGDAEVWWTNELGDDSKVIAEGYKSSRDHTSVRLNANGDFASTRFFGQEAKELIRLGRYGGYSRNDECGDDRNYPL